MKNNNLAFILVAFLSTFISCSENDEPDKPKTAPPIDYKKELSGHMLSTYRYHITNKEYKANSLVSLKKY